MYRKKILLANVFLGNPGCTFYCWHERDGKNEEGTAQVHDAQVLDQYKVNGGPLDLWGGDVDNDGGVGDNGDEDDEGDDESLQRLGEEVEGAAACQAVILPVSSFSSSSSATLTCTWNIAMNV